MGPESGTATSPQRADPLGEEIPPPRRAASPAPRPGAALLRGLLWTLVYGAAVVLGRLTIVDALNVGLVWPAAGVALLWRANRPGLRWLDYPLMAVATAVAILLTDGSPSQALLGQYVIPQTMVAVWLLQLWCPQMWGGGGQRPMHRLELFGRFLAAILLGALFGDATRNLIETFLLSQPHPWFGVRAVRNLVSMANLGSFGLLLGGDVALHGRHAVKGLIPGTRRLFIEACGVWAATIAIFALSLRYEIALLSFMLMLTVVWTAVRFTPLITALHVIAVALPVMVLTASGAGPFATIEDLVVRALVTQLFILVMVITGMTIGLTQQRLVESRARLINSEAGSAARAEELNTLVANLHEGVAIVSPTGRLVTHNPAFHALLESGAPAQRVPSTAEVSLYDAQGSPLTDDDLPWQRALAREDAVHEICQLRRTSGKVARSLEISARRLDRAEHESVRVIVVVRDITTQESHTAALANFARVVAHDLQNPLGVVGGWAEELEGLLKDTGSAPNSESLPMVRHIRASTDRMQHFVGDLLAHAISRDHALECDWVDLQPLAQEVAALRTERDASVRIDLGPLPRVWADRSLIRQLLDNLLGNAVRYVADGVCPDVVVTAEALAEGWVQIRVADNGIGIPPHERPRIFETFHRVGESPLPGTGLGLAICQQVVRRHGGDIAAVDPPSGTGACFEFSWPTTPEAFGEAEQSAETH